MRIKKGDTVMIMAGKDKGKTGEVTKAMPKDSKVLVAGMNIRKRHQKARKANTKGQTIEISHPMHVSNVMLLDPKSGKPTRVAIKRDEKGIRSRVAKKSGETIK